MAKNKNTYVYVTLRHFEYKHLPEHLQKISKPFYEMAHMFSNANPLSADMILALHKLLEAKDAMVRAFIP